MESLSLTTTTTTPTNTSKFRFPVPCYKNPKIYKNVGFRHKRCRKFVLFASSANKDDEKFDGYDQMEMKFGRMIGEDPKLTLAKIIGRKTNPELSSLEIEKLYNKKGMKAFTDIEEVPFDVSDIRKKRNDSLDGVNLTRPVPKKGVKFETNDSLDGLNLARPVPKKGVKFESNDSLEGLNLTRPAPKKGVRFEKTDPLNGLNLTRPAPKKGVQLERSGDKSVIPEVKRPNQTLSMAPNTPIPSVTNVELRKPTTFEEDDEGLIAMFQKPNLSYKVNREQEKERVTDMTMVRKPAPFVEKEDVEEPVSTEESLSEIQTDAALSQKPEPFVQNDDVEEAVNDSTEESLSEIQTDAALLQKPEPFVQNDDVEEAVNDEETLSEIQTDFSLLQKPIISVDPASRDENKSNSEIEDIKKSSEGVNIAFEMENGDVLKLQEASLAESQPSENTDKGFVETGSDPDVSATLRGPPKRLDQTVNNTPKIEKEVTGPVNPVPYDNAIDTKNLPTPPLLQDREDTDWKRAQDLIKTEGREEVELINSSTRGFVASFGSLIGFLPYRNLATKWKYLAFESWLRKKGLDPAMYRQSLGVIGGYDATRKSTPKSTIDPTKIEGELSADMKLEDLLAIYDQEKLKYLSSFVGQKVKVNVVLADRQSNKLIFSGKPKEKDESIARKKNLMAKLSVGDIVKCCIKKITYYGIFVEVEGVPALIHQTEVSWDDTLDIISHFKIGQIVEAKVHQLDFSLERIFLSLKEITPDPLNGGLEAIVGDQANFDSRLEAAEPDEEWTDVESLVKELQQYEGVDLVKKGGFFLSPGLAPTFQVYMASVLENEYKLLARAGNKVQEVIVQTSMGKEEMKSAILTCANRVA
ncbi:nucleic acid-binding, OB-fold-like protein [Artemisia annua]|uniref:Nucleic acid-binding, OB-fold-like protein n=1 Tax=Artemisia annua TaxID=35608 RepID=A0A2U1LU24_ARTAN|nr:nucleic acid-binding, OB-fold-like protein [Artemisia annua]